MKLTIKHTHFHAMLEVSISVKQKFTKILHIFVF